MPCLYLLLKYAESVLFSPPVPRTTLVREDVSKICCASEGGAKSSDGSKRDGDRVALLNCHNTFARNLDCRAHPVFDGADCCSNTVLVRLSVSKVAPCNSLPNSVDTDRHSYMVEKDFLFSHTCILISVLDISHRDTHLDKKDSRVCSHDMHRILCEVEKRLKGRVGEKLQHISRTGEAQPQCSLIQRIFILVQS